MSDYQYLDDTGVIVPDTSDILTDIENEYLASMPDLNFVPGTPQFVLVSAEGIARSEVVANNAAVANQINPNIAGGPFLEAICALTGLTPPQATFSFVPGVTVAGQPFTALPAGSQAKTSAGDIFESLETISLDASGNGVVDFQALVSGPVPCAINALATIVTDVLGWETVMNATAATLGAAALSDAALRNLRNNTLALQGISLIEATTSALNDVAGVKSLSFLENIANTTQTIDGISLVAHSIWVCVDGGSDTDVATSLLSTKSMGAAWNGSHTVNVVEPASGQTYAVKFERPTAVPIFARYTIRSSSAPANPLAQVQAATLAYANGQLANEQGFTVGNDVSPFELSAAVNSQIPGIFIVKAEVSLDGSTWQTTEITIDIDEVATIASGSISIILV